MDVNGLKKLPDFHYFPPDVPGNWDILGLSEAYIFVCSKYPIISQNLDPFAP